MSERASRLELQRLGRKTVGRNHLRRAPTTHARNRDRAIEPPILLPRIDAKKSDPGPTAAPRAAGPPTFVPCVTFCSTPIVDSSYLEIGVYSPFAGNGLGGNSRLPLPLRASSLLLVIALVIISCCRSFTPPHQTVKSTCSANLFCPNQKLCNERTSSVSLSSPAGFTKNAFAPAANAAFTSC